MVGQSHIREFLQRQISAGRVPHAQLFCGPEGCGKLAMAIEYAQMLIGQNADERGKYMLSRLQHPDLHFVFPVAKVDSSNPTSDLFINEWHDLLATTHYIDLPMWLEAISKKSKKDTTNATADEQDEKKDNKKLKKVQIYTEESLSILRKLSLVSSQGGYKVMIVWLPELMHPTCSNKILKILEEPPQQTVFILVSNHAEQLLDTIVSRCQRIDFKPLTPDEIATALVGERGLSEDMARAVAHSAAGSYTRALKQLTRNEDEIEYFNMFVMLMRKSYMRDIKEMRRWSEVVAGWDRELQKNFLEYCQRLVRENFIYNFQKPQLNFMTQTESDFSVRFARFINERNVIEIMDELSQAQRDIEQNTNSRMVFFDLALKMIVLLIR